MAISDSIITAAKALMKAVIEEYTQVHITLGLVDEGNKHDLQSWTFDVLDDTPSSELEERVETIIGIANMYREWIRPEHELWLNVGHDITIVTSDFHLIGAIRME